MSSEERKTAVGVCGVGAIGSAHASALYGGKIAGAYLAALCDTDPERRKKCAEQFPEVPIFSSHEELLASGLCTVLMVATPHYAHVPIAMDAMNCGVHVLSEKPVAVEVSVARRAVALAKERGVHYGVMFNQRTSAVYRKAKELISSGALGELRRAVFIATAWYRTQYYYDNGGWRATWNGEGGGVLLNQAPHNLDMLQWLMGMPVSVYSDCGISLWHDIEVEDDAVITGRYANGAAMVFVTTTGDMPGTARLEITGSKGKLLVENGRLKIFINTVDERDVRNSAKVSFYRADGSWQDITPEKDVRDGHEIVLANFVAVVDGREERLVCPAEEALNSLELSNAAYLSSHKGASVPLPCDSAEFDAMIDGYRKHGRTVGAGHVEYHDEYSARWRP